MRRVNLVIVLLSQVSSLCSVASCGVSEQMRAFIDAPDPAEVCFEQHTERRRNHFSTYRGDRSMPILLTVGPFEECLVEQGLIDEVCLQSGLPAEGRIFYGECLRHITPIVLEGVWYREEWYHEKYVLSDFDSLLDYVFGRGGRADCRAHANFCDDVIDDWLKHVTDVYKYSNSNGSYLGSLRRIVTYLDSSESGGIMRLDDYRYSFHCEFIRQLSSREEWFSDLADVEWRGAEFQHTEACFEGGE